MDSVLHLLGLGLPLRVVAFQLSVGLRELLLERTDPGLGRIQLFFSDIASVLQIDQLYAFRRVQLLRQLLKGQGTVPKHRLQIFITHAFSFPARDFTCKRAATPRRGVPAF